MNRFKNIYSAPCRSTLLLLAYFCVHSCSTQSATQNDPSGTAFQGQVAIADLHVVDCLLPGQVRQLGQRMFLSPRRPTRTTAADCRLRGGEYVAWDRADYSSALKVWMAAAEGGDAEAQTNVGEIFERGLGGAPNYEAAKIWYTKAAEQGNSRAQFNLGTMHEQGLGVPKSQLAALNWYRLAWGLSEDNLMFSSAAQREQETLRAELQQQLQEKEQQFAPWPSGPSSARDSSVPPGPPGDSSDPFESPEDAVSLQPPALVKIITARPRAEAQRRDARLTEARVTYPSTAKLLSH